MPLISFLMFDRWENTISPVTKMLTTKTEFGTDLSNSLSSSISTNGKDEAAVRDPTDTYRVVNAIVRKIMTHIAAVHGNRAIINPPAVATPLPPLKFAKTVQIWPTTADNPAIIWTSVASMPMGLVRVFDTRAVARIPLPTSMAMTTNAACQAA